MKGLETKGSRFLWILVAVALFCMPVGAFAQGDFTASELDTLVANIALYPDPLLVQVLAASTYGDQIGPADSWAQSHRHLKGKELSNAMAWAKLPYDPSVQALIPFPTVLGMMAKYPAWTDQLGDAVSMQKDDVMAAIQRLRHSAYKYGHLVSDERVKVTNGANITILPVRTEYVYVPVYNPYIVYYRNYDGYLRITYGPEVWTGGFVYWGWGSCWFDWGPRVIYVRDTRWHSPRHYPRHRHHYAPPPRRGHGVGPSLKRSSSTRMSTPAPAPSRPAAATSREYYRESRPAPSSEWDRPSSAPARQSSAPVRHERRNDDEPVNIGTYRESRPSGGSNPPPPPSSSRRQDDRDSRSDQGSSRGGFGGAIRR